VASADAGSTLDASVTASNAGGSATATSAPTATVPTPPTTATFGKTRAGNTSASFSSDRKQVNRYALSGSGSVTKLSVYLQPTSTGGQEVLRGVIYADSGGSPGTLLGVTNELTFASSNAAGWYDLNLPAAVQLSAGNYWIGVLSGATSGVAGYRYSKANRSRDLNSNTYSSGASNPFGSFTTDNQQMSLFATYTPS
jgi:hypothetical protein